jgi:deazaflavin-dependent oxidoreductase (nitroreductase family)
MKPKASTFPAILRTQRWFKPLAQVPMLGWRLGLDPIVGRFSMILTTTGRRSKEPRHTMVLFTELEGRKYIAAAYGPGSHWLRNLEADPNVTIQTAEGAEAALARRVTDQGELLLLFETMQREHPLALRAYLQAMGLPLDPAQFIAGTDRVVFVTFDQSSDLTPPPLHADLKWVWAMLPPVIAWRLFRRR